MNETESLNQKEWHILMRIILSVGGFILSIVFIFSGMFMLVRFWLITNFYYLLYMISTIFIGIMFTIFSSNLFLFTDVMTNKTIWPYLWFTPVTIFWNIMGIIQPYKHDRYFDKYSHIPVLIYPQAYYDADAYNERMIEDHPFTKAYKYSSVFFNNQSAVVLVLLVLLIIQIIFWIMSIVAYVPIFREYMRNKNVKVL